MTRGFVHIIVLIKKQSATELVVSVSQFEREVLSDKVRPKCIEVEEEMIFFHFTVIFVCYCECSTISLKLKLLPTKAMLCFRFYCEH